jgi:DNA polymerase III sliding clamp (beta) subunit (PCNA family)
MHSGERMKDEIAWITDAISTKTIAREMTHYRVQGNEIRATDGRLTAGHPFPCDGAFLVPGKEFEKLIKRFNKDPRIEVQDYKIVLTTGQIRATIKTLPIEEWNYPGVNEDGWEEAPEGLIDTLRDLLPFVSDNATQLWACGICLQHGYAYATNNVALAGVRCDQLGDINCIMPLWAAEFIVDREEGLTDWCWTDNYVAFRWSNGAWMRAQLIDAEFPEQAVRMVLSAQQGVPSTEITPEFRSSFERTLGLSDGLLRLSAATMGTQFGEATYAEDSGEELFELQDTLWSATHLAPVINAATHWDPGAWPKPSQFKGERLFGYVIGRKS